MTPSRSPTAGAHAIAAATTPGAGAVASGRDEEGGPASRHGITVSSVTDSLRPAPSLLMRCLSLASGAPLGAAFPRPSFLSPGCAAPLQLAAEGAYRQAAQRRTILSRRRERNRMAVA